MLLPKGSLGRIRNCQISIKALNIDVDIECKPSTRVPQSALYVFAGDWREDCLVLGVGTCRGSGDV